MENQTHPFDLGQYILNHVLDSHEWHILFLPPIKLPHFLSLHALMMLLGSLFLLILFCAIYKKSDRVPTGVTNLLEAFVQFIRDDIAVPFLGQEEGMKLTPFLCVLFFFILGLNLLGQIPLFATATSNMNVTAPLALITFYLMTVATIQKNGIKGFFKAFVPSGVPWPVLILIVPLEFLGLFIKTIALVFRLFVNMLAGHIIVLCLLGLIILFGIYALPAIVLAVAFSLLEILIVFLQAYIFVLLSAVFVGQMYHPDH
ncbi:MAG: F0F1 ATP synthase subunit A [Candidatus Omnitrophica bacterium]|nr:F0F1 ATP synthase subunit A [Candidatus Omnitrophota bacterium]